MAGSPIGDLGDFLKAFPQYTERDYMYKLSMAKITFLTHDATHLNYLAGKDKTIWEQYQKKNENQGAQLVGKSILDLIPEI